MYVLKSFEFLFLLIYFKHTRYTVNGYWINYYIRHTKILVLVNQLLLRPIRRLTEN